MSTETETRVKIAGTTAERIDADQAVTAFMVRWKAPTGSLSLTKSVHLWAATLYSNEEMLELLRDKEGVAAFKEHLTNTLNRLTLSGYSVSEVGLDRYHIEEVIANLIGWYI